MIEEKINDVERRPSRASTGSFDWGWCESISITRLPLSTTGSSVSFTGDLQSTLSISGNSSMTVGGLFIIGFGFGFGCNEGGLENTKFLNSR